ncbi:hypothetical protein NW762_013873 [Fusarium torreyae]|uniref:NWD NACHT-NTPase N-terminal domain-containing protein n=1 Tax=Fusarium torreyae TaxID=1237075 RepID=A0A9W8RNB3_9HYPO|nr:hypothetical protein NW762_013873 [Fusarium torreyae]
MSSGHEVFIKEADLQFQSKSLWAKAYKIVQDDEENAKLLEKFEMILYKGDSGATDQSHVESHGEERLKGIQILAKERLEKLPEARTSFTVGQKRIVVREYVQKAVQTIKQFKPIITGALSAEPHAALAWACILGVLPVLENVFQKDEDAADGLSKILFMLVRYQHLQESVLSCDYVNMEQSANVRELFSNIEMKLVDIYVKVYLYQIRFVLQYGQGKLRRNLGGILNPEDWKEKWKEIDSSIQLVDQAVGDRLGARIMETWKAVRKIEIQTEEFLSAVSTIDARTERIENKLKTDSERELLRSLKIAANAMFDSAKVRDAENPCLEGTQRQVLSDISDWTEDPSGELIFWLHGMAGTGKSSIALTVADAFKHGRRLTEGTTHPRTAFLGASFFFKQGDATRNHTENFFPTIARGLAEVFWDFMPLIAHAIDENSTIGTKAPQQQLENLIAKPLSILDRETVLPLRLVVVVDALDECAKSSEAEKLVGMLAEQLKALRRVQLRLLITSRSEGHITKSFAQLAEDLYRSVRLEKIRPPVEGDLIKDDITKYLLDRMSSIAKKHGVKEGDISESIIAQLSRRSDGLFIYAATACRFLDANDFDNEEARQERLDLILQSSSESDGSGSDDSETDDWADNAPQNKVDDIYRKVLSFPDRGMGPKTRKKTYESMEMVLGFLVVLFEPVAMVSLKEFLPSEAGVMDKLLKNLRAIVNVPDGDSLPLELIHLSFRDFILSRKRSKELKFRVEENCMHQEAFNRCLGIMSSMLCQDICGLVWPGTIDSEIPQTSAQSKIPQHLRYACRYWVDHLAELNHEKQRDVGLFDDGAVHSFLQKSFLFWLEVMGLIQETAAAVLIIDKLQLLVDDLEHPLLSSLIYDMKRFALSNRWIVDHAPLQIYLALIFSPEESQTRSLFQPLIPSWIVQKPAVDTRWTPELSVLQGHTELVHFVALSPDNSLVVSLSDDMTTRLWDTATGTERFRFAGSEKYTCAAFSPDQRSIVLGSEDGSINIRESAKGIIHRLNGHDEYITHLVYSPRTGKMLASTSWDSLRIWDIHRRYAVHVVNRPTVHYWKVCEFTPDEQYLIAGGSQQSIAMWSVKNGRCIRTFDMFDTTYPERLAISTDGSMASFYGRTERVTTFNLSTGERQFESSADEHMRLIPSPSWKPSEEKSVLVITADNYIGTLDATTGSVATQFQIPETESWLSISRDWKLLVSGGDDHVVRLWDMQLKGIGKQAPKSSPGRVRILHFSPEKTLIHGFNFDFSEVRLFDSTGSCLELPINRVKKICFSSDGRYVALWIDDDSCQLWDKDMNTQISTPKQWENIAFSPNSNCMAVIPSQGGVEIVNGTSFQEIMSWEQSNVYHMQFSSDGRAFTLFYWNEEIGKPVLEMWSLSSKKLLWQTILGFTDWKNQPPEVEFSRNGGFAAFRWGYRGYEEVEPWQIVDLATGRAEWTCPSYLVVFHPQDHLVALDHGSYIEIKETSSLVSKQEFKLEGAADAPDSESSMAFSTAKKFAAASSVDRGAGSKTTIQLWDLESGAEIGRYTVDGVIMGLSFSDEGYLSCDQGRLPLPSVLPDQKDNDINMEWTDAQDLLYVGSQWVYRGLERLMWLPAAFRSNASILDGDTLALAHKSGDVSIVKFDLAKLPVRRYG